MFLAQSAVRSVGFVIFAIVIIGFVVYLIFNLLDSKGEGGAEVELAANRKPYYDDDILETRKLDQSLMSASRYSPSLALLCRCTGSASRAVTKVWSRTPLNYGPRTAPRSTKRRARHVTAVAVRAVLHRSQSPTPPTQAL